MTEHIRITRNRREFMRDAFGGFGGLAFGAMLAAEQVRAQASPRLGNPLAPKKPHHAAKAKSVIFLFLSGRPSHMETFDPKPLLNKLHGKKRPAAFGEAKRNPCLRTLFCLTRTARRKPGCRCMQGFLPPVYQPTMFRPGNRPVLNLDLPKGITTEQRRQTLGLLKRLNHLDMSDEDAEFSARLNSYDLAFKMQTEAPAIFDLSNEPQETLDLYGIGKPLTDDYGRRCLLARRLVEKGVRFVCPVSGGGTGDLQWDAHKDIEENHLRMAAQTDQPMAALLLDLKRRGLLDETLVVIGGEFGRSPESEGSKGRDHHNLGFTMVMAGGGIKGGQVYGATDDIGLRAVEKPVHFRDIHTTILHQLGLDQEALSYLHLGREERLTEVLGNVITDIV
ncbi:MAG: DUF1501 domain-containing protein [Blastocatellia bacterium]